MLRTARLHSRGAPVMSSLEMPAMNSQAQHRTYSCKSVAILAELSVYEAVGHQCFQSFLIQQPLPTQRSFLIKLHAAMDRSAPASSSCSRAEQPSSSLCNPERPAAPSHLKILSIRDVERWLAEEPIASCSSADVQRIRQLERKICLWSTSQQVQTGKMKIK